MAGLTQCSHSDLLSIGLPSDDAVSLYDAIRNFSNTQGLTVQLRRNNQTPSSSHPLRHHRSPLLSGSSNGTAQTFLSNSSTGSATTHHQFQPQQPQIQQHRKSALFTQNDGFPV
uniref:Uncharacterized protein n=1 Tax=Panagrolaimus sp. ES5 TaxID=591445 RepID=A0AC34FLL3_9BILA